MTTQIPEQKMFGTMEDLRRRAWIRVLSAIQTSESMEAHVLEPLLSQFSDSREIGIFLRKQSDDEKRHSEQIKNYLSSNLDYVKTKPTTADRLFYSILFPLGKKFLVDRPIYAFSVLLFYEHFSVKLYKELQVQARRDGLSELVSLIDAILSDEAKHISGITQILKSQKENQSSVFGLNTLLRAVSLDVCFSRYAFHNREIRAALKHLDVDPALIDSNRKCAISKVCGLTKVAPRAANA